MLEVRSRSRRVARFISRPTFVSVKIAIGTEDEEQERQLPAHEARQDDTCQCPKRFGNDLAKEGLGAVAQELDIVGEARHELVRAVLAEVVDVEVNDVAIEVIAEVEKQKVDDAANERILPELKTAFGSDCDYHENDQPSQGKEAIGRSEAREIVLADLKPVQSPACLRESPVKMGDAARQAR